MARVKYATGSLFGSLVNTSIMYMVDARSKIERAMLVANVLTNQGANKAALEGSAEFGATAGQGAALYDAMVQVKFSLDNLLQLNDLDPGG